MCYSQLIDICSSASDSIPTTSSPSHHSKPGWNDNIKYLRDDALSWHYFWKINSRPGTGYIAEMRRLSRARYHRAVRHLKRAKTRMRTEKMAEALISNRSRDVWSEVERMKGRSRKSACIIDGVNGDKDIADLFSDDSKRHTLQAVELSQWFQAAVQIVSNLPAPSNGGPIYRFLGMPAMRTRWMAGAAAHKSG